MCHYNAYNRHDFLFIYFWISEKTLILLKNKQKVLYYRNNERKVKIILI